MKMNDIVTAVNQSSKRLGFSIKKKSPELLIAAGIIGFGGAIITACVATTKAGKIIEETQDALEGINDAHEKGVTNAGELYDDRDHKRDLTITYAQTGLKFAKLYAPTAILAVSSITCVLSSHRILKKRNLALAAAYAAVNQSFKDYRGRVLDRFGEQVEKELRYNLKPAEIEETVTDDKGKEKKVKKTVDMMDPSTDIRSISPYAVVFESTHEDWSKDKTTNEWYIKARQSQLNSKLRSQGHLFLNEVYDALGFPRTAVGAQVGWIFDERHPFGDNFVDFRATEIMKPKAGTEGEDAIYESAYIFDFNIAGSILDKIEDHQII